MPNECCALLTICIGEAFGRSRWGWRIAAIHTGYRLCGAPPKVPCAVSATEARAGAQQEIQPAAS
ncbi:TPA: hypothetical protein N0F65_011707 [Lagenidium giganteum]|uniref:Uncharacterized protein n=1 Tax=Lagenidium giganteum TaxID=4803 RepID=A0AAV2YY56_9STRA|nr:TPA: hypothetical protein N0F65_011707 [Lagenidium giganteum]